MNKADAKDALIDALEENARLRDLVERAVPMVEVLYDQTGYQRPQAGQWLRDVRGEE